MENGNKVSIKPIDQKYSVRIVWIHWISAILILGMVLTGLSMEDAAEGQAKLQLYRIHFSTGIIVLILTLLRVVALLKDPRPGDLYAQDSLNNLLVKGVHYGFYGVILYMCVSGLASIFVEGIVNGVWSGVPAELPNMIANGISGIMLSHHIVAKLVFLLLILHIGGIVLHMLRFRENVLRRVWR